MFFFFKQKTAYEMRISDWSSDVCSSDLEVRDVATARPGREGLQRDAAQRWRSDPGRLPDAPVRRAVEGVRRDGRGRVVRADVQIGRASCRERVCQYV